jgi:acetyl esterase/lipase
MNDPLVLRSVVTPAMEGYMAQLPEVPEVAHEVHHITSYDGQSIPVYRIYKKGTESATPNPAIVHAHGGGTVFGHARMFINTLSALVKQSGVQVFSVDYRLAPEHAFPTPVEDCYAALPWLIEHAVDFNIDPKCIGTMGESAGANLATSITLIARDRGLSPSVAKQILVYPWLDDRNTKTNPALEGLSTWSTEANIACWSAYLGRDFGTDRVSQYAAPARATNLKDLPPTYLEVGNLDMFLGETMEYASRLAQANVQVEVHVYPGLPHAFDTFAPLCEPTKRAQMNRAQAASTL